MRFDTIRGRISLMAAVTGLLALSGLMGLTATAQASTHNPGGASCTTTIHAPIKLGHAGGFVRPHASKAGHCVKNAGDPAIGNPPLLYHGGPIMPATKTSKVVVTPIYWVPTGFPMTAAYRTVINNYLHDVQVASGTHTNVFSTDNQYTGTNGTASYWQTRHAPIIDHSPLPKDCTVGPLDKTGIYSDGSGYKACVSDNAVIAETEAVRAANSLPADYKHIYILFLPKHVESCFNAGSSTTGTNACTINHYPSAAYCAYHGQNTATGMVYANMPYAIYNSSTGFSCTDEGLGGGIQSPNGNTDADVEISPTSHEMAEAFTDPDVSTGWYDASGFENGDECAYTYGALQGTAGGFFNQVINTHHYLTQEEFSNLDFASSGGAGGCLQSE